MMNRTLPMALALATSLTIAPSLAAWAHNGVLHGAVEPGEHAHKAPHGGAVKTVGSYHFELVAKHDRLLVYLMDNAMKALPTAGVTGQVILQVPKQDKQEVELKPVGDHLEGPASLKDVKSLVAVVSLKLDGKPQSARFKFKG